MQYCQINMLVERKLYEELIPSITALKADAVKSIRHGEVFYIYFKAFPWDDEIAEARDFARILCNAKHEPDKNFIMLRFCGDEFEKITSKGADHLENILRRRDRLRLSGRDYRICP